MSYYHLPTSTERSPGRLERKLSDDAFLGPPDTGWTAELAALCGFVVVVDTARPADDATTTYDRTITLPGGIPTVTWTARPKTASELTSDTQQSNRTTINTQAADALAANRTYLAIVSPSAAQTTAQVKALTRQTNGIIRLLLNQLDGTT